MKHITSPGFDGRLVFEECAASIRDADLRGRLMQVVPNIEAAGQDYLQRALNCQLYSIAETNNVAMIVSGAEMERLYSGTFVKSVRTRHIYDAIKKLPPNDICPLCNQRTVFTLDHYLPQSRHAVFVVLPENLVPACAECNKIKLALAAAAQAEQTLHPYFDNFDDARWLSAVVQETVPARLIFDAAPPAHWDQVKRQRAVNHFKTFQLSTLYASHSAVELTSIRHLLTGMSARKSPEEIQQFLAELAASHFHAQPNSWQTATYCALASSPWYCGGGFGLVA